MKKLIFTIFGILLLVFSKGQTISYSADKNTTLSDETTIDLSPSLEKPLPVKLTFKITKIPTGKSIQVNVSDNDDGTATLTNDYKYDPAIGTAVTLTAEPKGEQDFIVAFSQIPAKKTNAVFNIKLSDKNTGKQIKTYKITVNFNSGDETVTSKQASASQITVPDTAHWSLRIVTGGNFNFFNGPTIKDFAGDITAFVPNLFHIGNFKFGVEFGINNYHYFNSDSNHTASYTQAYFLKYQNYYAQTDSSKVVKSSQTTNGQYNYNVWGIHVDPIFPFPWIEPNDFAQLYLKLHVEELATTVTYTPTLGTPVNDTITLKQYNSITPALPAPTAHSTADMSYAQETFYDYYVGVGIPFVIKIQNIATICMSPSAGLAYIELANPAFVNDPIHRDIRHAGGNNLQYENKFYTLNKFQLVTNATAVNLALGGEYRSVSQNMHYFTTYIGATVSIDKLK